LEIGIFSLIIEVNLKHLYEKDAEDFTRIQNQL